MKHFVANTMTLAIVVGMIAAGAVMWTANRFAAPGPTTAAQRVALAQGVSLRQASETLAEAGVISSAAIFRIGVRYRRAAGRIKYGEYEIPASASMEDVLQIVVGGKSVQYSVTVVEGMTTWAVLEALKANPILSGDLTETPGEGQLAPDTYFVQRGANRNDLVRRMAAAQVEILEDAWRNQAPGLPLNSPEEALILASIVEKETGVASERAMVAGVFVNRLNRGMRLQSDPTIIYGLTQGRGGLGRGIRRSEIDMPTAYNTYVIDRLPPGPIANPGRDAITATLRPAQTKALYFVADGTGGHAFAETLREHQRNVAAWRRVERARGAQ